MSQIIIIFKWNLRGAATQTDKLYCNIHKWCQKMFSTDIKLEVTRLYYESTSVSYLTLSLIVCMCFENALAQYRITFSGPYPERQIPIHDKS